MEKFLKRRDAAQILNCSLKTVDNYLKEGRIRKIKLTSKNVLIPESSLNQFLTGGWE